MAEILWRRLDRPGHEAARIAPRGSGWELRGTAVFPEEGRSCRLDYQIDCDAEWRTLAGWVEGWVGEREVGIEIAVESGRWRLNEVEVPEVAGCVDLDLNFSPVTNLLPIRRVPLEIGREAEVRAAWLRFPGFHLEPLPQTYRRLDATTWRYESAGGEFVRDLQVNEHGFVTLYPDFWRAE